jgi:RimJ/RimL family protein N-acetyltransferase
LGFQRRGQCYATDASRALVGYLFDGYPCQRIGAFVDVENAPSRRVLEKIGFDHEGTLRRASFRDGAWRRRRPRTAARVTSGRPCAGM